MYEDTLVLQFLKGEEVTGYKAEKKRARQRALQYELKNGVVYKRPTKTRPQERVVPKPSERQAIHQAMHDQLGHLGKNNLAGLVLSRYYWRGAANDCAQHVANCQALPKQEGGVPLPKEMQPREIVKLGHRVHLDIMGPFKSLRQGVGPRLRLWLLIASQVGLRHMPYPIAVLRA